MGKISTAIIDFSLLIGDNTTNYLPVANCIVNAVETTEANAQIVHRTAGTYSKLLAYISANGLNTSTIRLRIGGVNGNQVLSIGENATGFFEDTTHTDAIAAGNLVSLSVVADSGSDMMLRQLRLFFESTSVTETVTRYAAYGTQIYDVASVTVYNYLAGIVDPDGTTTEAHAQFKFKTAGTLKNLNCYISANTRPATTVRTRINGGDGNQSLSIGASATGWFEDVAHTDAVAVNDLCNYSVALGTGTNALYFESIGCDFITINNKLQLFGQHSQIFYEGITSYLTLTGGNKNDATESNQSLKFPFVTKFVSNLEINISDNTINGTSTLKTRIDGGNGNQSISITAATTGWFEDTVHTDTFLPANVINLILAAGGTSGEAYYRAVGILCFIPWYGHKKNGVQYPTKINGVLFNNGSKVNGVEFTY